MSARLPVTLLLALLGALPPGAHAQATARTHADNTSPPAPVEGLPAGARLRLGSLLQRHAGDVTGLVFDELAGQLASHSPGDGWRRWSLETGAALAGVGAPPAGPLDGLLPDDPQLVLRRSDEGRQALRWSHAHTRVELLTVSEDGGLAPARPLDLAGRPPFDAAFDAGGRWLVIVGERISGRDDYGTWVRCLELPAGRLAWELDQAGIMPADVALVPAADGHPPGVALAGRDGELRLLARDDGRLLHRWQAHDGLVSRVLASDDGALLLSGGSAGDVAAWQLSAPGEDGGAPPLAWRASGHLAPITSLACSDALGLVASGSRDRRVLLWSRDHGQPLLRRPTHPSRLTAAALSPDGERAASASWAGRVGLWTGAGRHERWLDAHDLRVTGLAFVDGGRLLLSVGQDGRLRLTEAASGEPAAADLSLGEAALALAVAADGRHVAVSGGGEVHLFSLAPEAQDGPALVPQGRVPAGGRTGFALAYAPDGQALAVGTNRVRLIDAASGALRWEVPAGAPVGCLSISHDGRLLAAGLASRQVLVLDLADGSEVWRWTDLPGRVAALAFGPDGRLAVAGGDTLIRLRSPGAEADEARLEGHREPVTALRWEHPGALVSAGADGTALVWAP